MSDSTKSKASVPHILPMEGDANFRELGGYPAADGRLVKYGLFFRSGALGSLRSDNDRALLKSLGLKLVLDFRSAGESEENPDFMPDEAKYQRIGAMFYSDGTELDFSPAGMERLERERSAFPQQSSLDLFIRFYAQMPFGNPGFQAMFQALEAGDVPILFHCTAGKDRTGIAAILLLLALGVDRDIAVADYMETNRCRAAEIKTLRRQHEGLEKEAPEQWEQLLIRYGVLLRCANAALDAILERYGSWETYFYEEYGLDHNRLAALRDAYLS